MKDQVSTLENAGPEIAGPEKMKDRDYYVDNVVNIFT